MARGLVGKLIQERRKGSGESRAALAALVDISESQLRALELERDLPSIPTLKKVAKFFRMSPEDVGKFVLQARGIACGPRPKAVLDGEA